MGSAISVRARWVWTGDGWPRENFRIQATLAREISTIDNHGKDWDVGDYCLIPGLINAHTHLEFSDLREPISVRDNFSQWISDVVAYRRAEATSATAQQEDSPTIQGLNESTRAGVQFVCDIVHPRFDTEDKNEPATRRCQFAEVLATTSPRARETWRAANRLRKKLARDNGLFFGLSPHAPYTTTPRMVAKSVAHCRRYQLPITMHLAESRDEIEWLETGKGSLQNLLERVVGEAFLPVGSRWSVVEYLDCLSRAPVALIAHGNYLDDASRSVLQRTADHMALVYCPRTHAHFGHDRYPLESLIQQGVSVVLGTDSRASNPDLSILEEARWVRRNYRSLKANAIMKLVTTEPARILSRVAKYADWGWTAVPCRSRRSEDVMATILDDSQSAVRLESLLRK